MENTTEVEYISIYDKPKTARGRPSGSKYSGEEKRHKTEKQIPIPVFESFDFAEIFAFDLKV